MPDVYVDTNGFSDLFRRGSAMESELRREIRTAGRDGRFRFLTSGWTIEELTSIGDHDWPKYERIADYVFDLVGSGLLDDQTTLIERELSLGRALHGAERMIPEDDLPGLRTAWMDRETARKISDQTQREKAANRDEMRALRAKVSRELAEIAQRDPRARGDPKRATLLWYEDPAARIDNWTREHLADLLRGVGRDPAIARDYPLDRIPTLRNIVSSIIGRIVWNVGHGRRIDEGDNMDTAHFVCASYTDLFVSGDRALREMIQQLPAPQVRVLSLRDFAENLGQS